MLYIPRLDWFWQDSCHCGAMPLCEIHFGKTDMEFSRLTSFSLRQPCVQGRKRRDAAEVRLQTEFTESGKPYCLEK
jgi:hypothetical protein